MGHQEAEAQRRDLKAALQSRQERLLGAARVGRQEAEAQRSDLAAALRGLGGPAARVLGAIGWRGGAAAPPTTSDCVAPRKSIRRCFAKVDAI